MTANISKSLADLDHLLDARPLKDRFIPSRSSFKELAMTYDMMQPRKKSESDEGLNDENRIYCELLKRNFKEGVDRASWSSPEFLCREATNIKVPAEVKKSMVRKIPRIPFKVLDAPYLQDDYYLNVIDWSASDNLAVGLGNAVYMWGFKTSSVEKITYFEDYNLVTGVSFDKFSDTLSLGVQNGSVQIWDVNKKKCVSRHEDHFERVGAMSLYRSLLITGSRDRSIILRDLRTGGRPIQVYKNHKQEICGLKWSPDGQYFASGGNDNKLFVYSPKTLVPLMKKNHKAAVKAIAWSEKNFNVLASGAGTADRCIRLWNISERKLIESKDTGSQICNIVFSKQEDEIITSHGFSNNEVCVWKQKGLRKLHTFSGHTSRVLYLSMNPTGDFIVTGAGDETLRFWNLGYNNNQVLSSKPFSKSLVEILR